MTHEPWRVLKWDELRKIFYDSYNMPKDDEFDMRSSFLKQLQNFGWPWKGPSKRIQRLHEISVFENFGSISGGQTVRSKGNQFTSRTFRLLNPMEVDRDRLLNLMSHMVHGMVPRIPDLFVPPLEVLYWIFCDQCFQRNQNWILYF